ncbi:MAG: peptide ABC transporter permease [Dehalococcoidia bacterium]|nr:peptide ABC transporter permease [Dehalococcoidia bacterium]
MEQTQIERDLLGLRRYPPVIQQLAVTWRFTRRYPTIPLVVLAVLIFIAVFAPFLAPHDTRSGGIRNRHLPPAWAVLDDGYTVKDGNMDHVLGTDHAGRDVMSRLFFGARISLVVAGIALTSGFLIGTTMGITSGFAGGWWDEIVTRTVDIFAALPFLMMALVATMMFGQSLRLLLVLMALLAWVPFVRVTRSQTLVIKNEPYVDLARVAGCSTPRILIRHILPGVLSTAVVIATLSVGSLILAEAALSFLGAGVPSPTPTWGAMVQEGRNYLSTAWWPTVFPGVAIFLTVMSLNFTGDWLRDRLDPRLRQLMD